MKFNQTIEPLLSSFFGVKVSKDKIEKLKLFVSNIINAKTNESHHQIDNQNEYKRFYTGYLGELAIEQYLNIDFFDWSIGKSSKYNVADLKKVGLDIGIKTVEYGKFPIIHKHIKRPEIINLKITDDTIAICGLATIEILKKYKDDSLVLSRQLLNRGTKTGFYGFEHLIKFTNLNDLKL